MIKAVLFDLDGTLADTAPDLGYAVNHMRETRGLPPLPSSATRPVTSLGARGLLNAAFGIGPDHPDYGAMREEFLLLYEKNICRETRLFSGIPELLNALEARGLRWGVVTNKSERLARLLLDELRMKSRAACIIGGDSTPRFKPHPDPLFAACRAIHEDPGASIYVGDDQRDVEAGHAAGMKVAAVRWGYLNGGKPESWNADWMLEQPQDLLRHLR
jgi:phosphoglycolate phosphatase